MLSTENSHHCHFLVISCENVVHDWQSSCYWCTHANLLSSSQLKLAVAFSPSSSFVVQLVFAFVTSFSFPNSWYIWKRNWNTESGIRAKSQWSENMLASRCNWKLSKPKVFIYQSQQWLRIMLLWIFCLLVLNFIFFVFGDFSFSLPVNSIENAQKHSSQTLNHSRQKVWTVCYLGFTVHRKTCQSFKVCR